MTWIVFDCPSGISGDMTLGALVDLGVPLEEIRAALATLPVAGWSLRADPVTRNGIAATQVRVELSRPQTAEVHRHLDDVVAILQAGKLPPRALAWAIAVFQKLAAAEAAVHREPVERVHFHEVGALDAIVDVAGSCVGLDWLCARHGAQHLRVAQLRLGRGQVRTEHGTMPVPPPAVLRLLEGFPVRWGEADGERVTPTGAAIIAALASPLDDTAVRVRATGYGAGTREFPDVPNVLRILVADPEVEASKPGPVWERSPAVHRGQVAVLRTTIDDMVPEFFGHVMDRLFAAGAFDVQYTPVQMKKGRPATLVTVIAPPDSAESLAALVLNETTTLGVRVAYEERFELARQAALVHTPYGPIRVKIAVRPDGEERIVPEYESVRQAAAAAGKPIGDVHQAALRAAADGLAS